MKKLMLLFGILWNLNTYAYQSAKAGFTIEINGKQNPYKVFSIFVMPGGIVNIKSTSIIYVESEDLEIQEKPNTGWEVKSSSAPGVYNVQIKDSKENRMTINVLVLTPLTSKKGAYLNGYRIGNYPATALKGNPIYNKPKGLFEVTTENQDLQLTPHFTLKQFLCKQGGGYPKYLIIREQLLLKLEYLLEKVNDNGFTIETFGFISGYRTPFYNASIRNVQYSRHVYGGAADIFIDQNKDGSMDDLNNDGRIDEQDVKIFHDIVSKEFDKPSYDKFKGGLGFYRKNARHNGFIHVDVRGWKARW